MKRIKSHRRAMQLIKSGSKSSDQRINKKADELQRLVTQSIDARKMVNCLLSQYCEIQSAGATKVHCD